MDVREVPTSKPATLWRGGGRWYQQRRAAYYAIAKAMVLKRYPVWLDDQNMSDADKASEIPDWDARRDRMMELFYSQGDGGYYFNADRYKRFVRRLAKFLAFVDSKAVQ